MSGHKEVNVWSQRSEYIVFFYFQGICSITKRIRLSEVRKCMFLHTNVKLFLTTSMACCTFTFLTGILNLLHCTFSLLLSWYTFYTIFVFSLRNYLCLYKDGWPINYSYYKSALILSLVVIMHVEY